MADSESAYDADVILVGGGIMSATLAALLALLEPSWRIRVFEKQGALATESSDPWNNAGTGHSALCELNYTSRRPDGTVAIAKAVAINEQFQVSRQFWAHLVETGLLTDPKTFINPVPHMSFVPGQEGIDYLTARRDALVENPLFAGLEVSSDAARIAEWVPLVMAGRDAAQPVAATRIASGTDVDFGSLATQLFGLASARGVHVRCNAAVIEVGRRDDGGWAVGVRDQETGIVESHRARFVFVGAGGGALHLLQKSRIPEIDGFGGFPISGQFLRSDNPEVVAQHHAKVYGQAAVGAPPMSVPHLDSRIIAGQHSLLFGPFAGFSPKFLKKGSWWDLPGSVRLGNIVPMLAVAKDNLDLVRYLVSELAKTSAGRIEALREYYPNADAADWRLITAGQRVQVIKHQRGKGGILQFGTEVVASRDGSIAGLLGASPGASTAVPIMLTVLKRCFSSDFGRWEPQLRDMIPSLGTMLSDDPEAAKQNMQRTARILELD